MLYQLSYRLGRSAAVTIGAVPELLNPAGSRESAASCLTDGRGAKTDPAAALRSLRAA